VKPLNSASQPDRIHFGDVVEIDELGGFDFDWRGNLNPDGYLDKFTKVAEPIFALCKTPTELEEIIRAAYGRSLRDPQVVVRILDRSQRPLAILDGAIKQPMRLQIRRPVRLNELLVIGGGITDRASGEISILRPAFQSCEADGDTTVSISIRVEDILGGKAEANANILPGDIVTVGVVQSVYVVGGVNRPGRIDWREGATVTRVVASAGGVSDRGISGKVSIFRREAAGEKVIEADLARIVAGDEKDIEISPLDVIDVPFKGASRQDRPVFGGPTEGALPRSLPIRVID
jgi:protein involved in polysaccharide export with SLBB domain